MVKLVSRHDNDREVVGAPSLGLDFGRHEADLARGAGAWDVQIAQVEARNKGCMMMLGRR